MYIHHNVFQCSEKSSLLFIDHTLLSITCHLQKLLLIRWCFDISLIIESFLSCPVVQEVWYEKSEKTRFGILSLRVKCLEEMMIIMVVMNYFCEMANWRKCVTALFQLGTTVKDCRFDTLRAGFELSQNLSSVVVKGIFGVLATATHDTKTMRFVGSLQ